MASGMAGYAGTPLGRKLGIERGMTVRLLDAPDDYWEWFGSELDGLELVHLAPDAAEKARFTHLFASELEPLRAHFAAARAGMTEDGMVWASWPKQASGVPSRVDRAEVMEAGHAAGLVDVKVCAVDATWSGLKFVIPVAHREAPDFSPRPTP